ncbi:tetratricopeptide repeat protein [Aquimarina sp. ERC-38]|uniref:type IX secretion system periplasmic lipoprotein PorW/SprE n=1 Tax=Aquimarina sp. ERC-38 TaxID=2949996 RepID=UPI0022470BA7|nr:tetratricopeptide repeat protein [Aquimarina sp. ERC-38]UZO81896.1 tetratricopeptide repeat protein [Aquimarina sp. ERC-38]
MKNFSSNILIIISIALIGLSCSRKKDKWVNRNWHSLTTKNNTLYNGRVAFDAGKEDIVNTYRDNFWEVLPVERLIVSEDVRLPNEVLNENFDLAETKAAKSIQKHSMLIDDRERNTKIDESFMLLGKARYNEQRFIPALEAFNYILYKYPSSNNINLAKVWRAKTNIRLDNNEKAIKDLTRMISQEIMAPQDYANAASMIAQAYYNLKLKDSAVTYIDKAAAQTEDYDEKGRYYIIKGQLLNELGFKDSANLAFDKVIELNRRTPRRYLLNAYMAKARNFDYEEGNKEEFLELLTKLEENRENRPFLDMIYYQKGEYFRFTDSLEAAVTYYNQSLRQNSEDRILESKNYNILGNISFDDREYAAAGAYYDSTLERMVVNSKKYRVLKKKRENLDDVILYEGIAQTNDSILRIARLSPEEKTAFYKKYTDSIKAIAIAEAKAAEIQRIKDGLPVQQRFQQPGTGLANQNAGNNSNENGGVFYFYNPTIVGFGKTAFKRKFGNRELQDNWKIVSISDPSIAASKENEEEEEKYDIEKDPVFDPQTYVAQVPSDPKILDSLQTDRNFAYYQLGVIYKEKFQEYGLATEKFEGLLVSDPEERLILPSKYNLYKIYQLQQESDKMNAVKADIVNNYPESSYAQILLNPEKEVEGDKNSPEAIYNRIYHDFENEKYASVIKEADAYATKFGGEDFVPKFELLKAQAIGRYEGFEAYKKALNYVALNFPQSPEGKKAQQIYNNAFPQLEQSDFAEGTEVLNNHKLVYVFPTINKKQAEELKENIDLVIKELRYNKMKVSLDFYTKDSLFVVVHTRRDQLGAEGLGELLTLGKTEDSRNADLTRWNRKKIYYPAVERPYFVAATPNYRIIQIHKNVEKFIALQEAAKDQEEKAEEPPQTQTTSEK